MMREDGEEGPAARGAGDGEGEPAYHARRPMNAFLIFCKRHRAVVRDKYPNLENRSITKILGEWWANLEEDDKSCYTGLAKQYKDAFFNANPDFKWYKLPAPPLRNLNHSRAHEQHSPPSPPPRTPDSPELRTNNNSTRFDYNSSRQCEETMFTPGKLADEAHMGGLSSLMSLEKHEKPDLYSDLRYVEKSPYQTTKPKGVCIQDLQNALSETTRMFEDFDDKPNIESSRDSSDRDLTSQEVDGNRGARDAKAEDDLSRSGRSCKGKRYQEFMAGGLLAAKRPRTSEWDGRGDEACSENSDGGSPAKRECPGSPDRRSESTEPEDAKRFRPADFDLDAKIAALPALSLERFQQRKRESKKKRRAGFSIRAPAPPSRPQQEAERWREVVIGSQKRKPRKVSITRLHVNSMVNRTEDFQTTPEMKIASEAPLHEHRAQTAQNPLQSTAADLFALTTLAEVAANTSKLEATPAPHLNLSLN